LTAASLHLFRISVHAFVSVRDNLDLSTPSGRLTFQVVGAMAEFERALTQERLRAAPRLAQSKGTKLGHPRATVVAAQVATLRAAGASMKVISRELGIGVGTACRALQPRMTSM
jgi:DNA invertase Pin-like site-specific DNA recombinase